MNPMKRWVALSGLAALAGLVMVILLASTTLAQRPTPTPRTPSGQWGSPKATGVGGMMGGGMMSGGMMGGWTGSSDSYSTNTEPLTIQQAAQAVVDYLASLNQPDLAATEVMEFANNFYAEVEEKSTGIHAFELLVDKYTGTVYPEMGPNMMWNTKYGMMGNGQTGCGMMSGGMMSGWTGGGMMGGGMMGGWTSGSRRGNVYNQAAPTAKMPVSKEQAIQEAEQFLSRYAPGSTVAEPDTFYGYYTLHTLKDGQITGMLSVNGYTGQVWYHNWHGDFIQMLELGD